MKHSVITLLFLALGMTSSMNAQKFGFVDTAEIVQSMPQVKEANANIETYRTQLQKKGQEKLKALQAKYGDLETKQGRGEISRVELEAEVAKLKQEEAELMKFDQESQEKIIAKSQKLLQPLTDQIQAAITEVASEQGYAYIFDSSTGFVLYADTAADCGPLVRAKLGL
jgi:outer membrane protein